MRIPKHIAVIPDGNRRWAKSAGFEKHEGYSHGLNPGLLFLKLCRQYGVGEVTYYGFTTDNCKRPKIQVDSFCKACVEAVNLIATENVDLLVVGNTESPMFPAALLPYTSRTTLGKGGIKVNFLVNYGWEWDLNNLSPISSNRKTIHHMLHSHDVSRIDLIIRLGGRRRLSGLLPIQSVYADLFSLDVMWPDFTPAHFEEALAWYNMQDITLGG